MNNQRRIYGFFWKPEKEEAWLERMSLEGWHLKKVSSLGFYTFEQGQPEHRVYKLDYRYFTNPRDREDYLALFADSGWQPVMAQGVNYTYYFYNLQQNAKRDIFSDGVSRAERNLRYATLMFCSLFPALLPLIVVLLTGNANHFNPGYQTPGLWEMTGMQFLFHFLFETPFVVLRSSIYIFPLLPILLALVFVLRYYLTYRKAARQEIG